MSNPQNIPTNTEHVLIITDGPQSFRTVFTSSGTESYPDPVTARQHLQTALAYRDPEVFYMMAGSICLGVRNVDRTLEIEPLLIAPIPVTMHILDWRDEPANPHGIMILGRVEGVLNYDIQLSDNYRAQVEPPIVRIGTIVQLSYHLEHCTGGIAVVDRKLLPEHHRPPLINSLSEVQRVIVGLGGKPTGQCSSNHRGRSFYQVTSTEHDRPVGYNPELIANL